MRCWSLGEKRSAGRYPQRRPPRPSLPRSRRRCAPACSGPTIVRWAAARSRPARGKRQRREQAAVLDVPRVRGDPESAAHGRCDADRHLVGRRMPVRPHVRRALLRREPADLLARRLLGDVGQGLGVRRAQGDGRTRWRRSTSPRSSRSARCACRDTVGLPFDLLPKQIGNTEIIYVPLPGVQRAHPRARQGHRRRLAGLAAAAAAQGARRRQPDRRSVPERSDRDRRSAAPHRHARQHARARSALGRLRRDGRRRAQRAAASVLQRERQADEDEAGPAVRRRRAGRHRRDRTAGFAAVGEALKLDPARRRMRSRDEERDKVARRDGRLSRSTGSTFMVAGYEGPRVLARAPADRSRRERAVSLDRGQHQPARARRGSLAQGARLHRALRRELRRRDRRARPTIPTTA